MADQKEEHRQLFQEIPEKFAPQYDGYCAWAMTEARKAETDPEVWKIVDGKLYLNCSMAAYEKWSRDIPGNIRKADANWARFMIANRSSRCPDGLSSDSKPDQTLKEDQEET
ncbi:YHS domain-containing (seleno)protein, partial [Desulfocastanea catecholica]